MLEVPVHLAGQGQAVRLIPPGSTTFHLLLAVHIAAALTCVVTGAVAALSRKRLGRHPRLGTLYYRSLCVCVWWSPPRPGWPPCTGRRTPTCWRSAPCRLPPPPLAAPPRRRRWQWRRWRWIGLHLAGMSAYILLVTAFYVDNGKNLPVWRSLPYLAYWLLPSAVGLPLVAGALARYHGFATRRPTDEASRAT